MKSVSYIVGILQKSFFWAWLDVVCQYRRSRIGPFWETINVIVMILGLTLVSSTVFGGDVYKHLGYIGLGTITWSAINSLINEGANTFVRSSALITGTNIDIFVYVGRTVFKVMITFAHHFIIYAIGLILLIVPLGWTSLLAIPGLMLLFANGFWVVTLLGFVCARYRDVELIIRNLLQLAFFFTPVFWNYHDIPPGRHFIIDYNVAFYFLEIVRSPLLGEIPPLKYYVVAVSVSIVGIAHTVFVVRKMRQRLAFFV